MRFIRNSLPLVVLGAFGALGALGCSDPVPPTPDGAYRVNFTGKSGCNIMGHTTQIGDVTDTQRTTVVPDGTDGTTVTCTVSGAGPFAVTGHLQHGADSLQIRVDLPTDASKATPAKGGVGFLSTTTGNSFVASSTPADPVKNPPCNFYFANSKESVASGKVWVAFSCDTVTEQGSADPSTCGIDESYVILENCSQE